MFSIGAFVLIAIAGVGVGVLSGMLGVGGGTVMIPLFRLVFGLSAVVSTATSLFAIIPTSVSGLITHLREKTCIPKLGLAMGIAGACTSTLGVRLANISPAWLIMVVAAIIIAYSAFNMLRKAVKPKKKPAAEGVVAGSVKAGGAVDAVADKAQTVPAVPPCPELSGKQLLQGALIGLVAGLASGYVGVGGGFIMIPMMLGILGIPMLYASGTSLIAIIILAIPGVITQIMLGHIDFIAGIAISVGTIPGAVIGSLLAKRVPERTLRLIFSGMLFVAAVMLVVNEFALI